LCVLPDAWEDEIYVLSDLCPQGVFSNDEALYHHGMIDREPLQHTITIYSGYGTFRLVKDGINVFTVKKELLELGKKLVKNPFGHIIHVYNRERTSCDLVRSRSWFEIQDFQTSLKYYVHDNNKDLGKLMEYVNERT